MPGITFHYFDLPSPFLIWKRKLGYYGLHSYYYMWQLRLWSVARRLHSELRFDLVHHVTFVNDWMPSGLAGTDAPFIWGPVGGSTHVMPSWLETALPLKFRRYELGRRIFQMTLHRLDPLLRTTRRRATMILTYTEEAMAGIPDVYRGKARPIVHIGGSGK